VQDVNIEGGRQGVEVNGGRTEINYHGMGWGIGESSDVKVSYWVKPVRGVRDDKLFPNMGLRT